jgi:uncharacterized protein YjbI with pentapeptide repeats
MTDRERGPILPAQVRGASTSRHRLMGVSVLSATLATCIAFRVTDGDAAPALPGDPCHVDPRPNWSETEDWVWERVCSGEIADLNEYFDPGSPPLDPRSPEGWSDQRKLSSAFLETILMHDPWRNTIPHHGVRIAGAWFAAEFDLQEAGIAHGIKLDGSRFDADVNLSGAKIASTLSLENSTLRGVFNLSNGKIGGDLSMEDAEFAEIGLRSAEIGGVLRLIDAKVADSLDLNGATLDGALLRGGSFGPIDAVKVSIARNLELDAAKVTGALDASSAGIDGDLFIRDGAEFDDVFLRGARVDGQVDLSGTRVSGTLDMDGAVIGQSLYMYSNPEQRAEFNDVFLRGAQIGGQVNLIGAKAAGALDMDAASIGQILLMRSNREQQAEFQEVILRGAEVGG